MYPRKYSISKVKWSTTVLKIFVNMLKGLKMYAIKSHVPSMFGFLMRIFWNSVAEKRVKKSRFVLRSFKIEFWKYFFQNCRSKVPLAAPQNHPDLSAQYSGKHLKLVVNLSASSHGIGFRRRLKSQRVQRFRKLHTNIAPSFTIMWHFSNFQSVQF